VPASRRYRPPIGFPDGEGKRGRWQAPIISIVLHALASFLLLLPGVAAVQLVVNPRAWGLRGLVRGGGGGGARQEHLRYVQTAPPPPPTVARAVVPRRPPVPKPLPAPVLPPPLSPAPAPEVAVGPQTGAGTTGVGPGAGGGVGAGVGTGAGSGTGPGTAGNPSERRLGAEPPEVIPTGLDAPKGVQPRHIVAMFIVAPSGEAHLVSVTQTSDGGYNRHLRDELEQMTRSRWQPASLDGVAVADTVPVVMDLP